MSLFISIKYKGIYQKKTRVTSTRLQDTISMYKTSVVFLHSTNKQTKNKIKKSITFIILSTIIKQFHQQIKQYHQQ